MDFEEQGLLYDPTKTVLSVDGLDGETLYNTLIDKHQIYIEKFTSKVIIVTVHACIIQEDVDALIAALESISMNTLKGDGGGISNLRKGNEGILGDWQNLLSQRQFKIDIRDVLASEKETLPIEQCVGKISAEVYYSCPPGYPLLIYGEVITKDHIQFLKDKTELKVLKN